MTPADHPYLSLVVTARYDDHGGNFMHRMQAFLNAFIEQCRRYKLPAEVVVVEWNPLPDRCSLAQALEWPIEMDWCQVRFIEVPPELHARYEHSSNIALYQMIAKNVAIRRVRGEWVLATNIDIFFNEPMMQFLAEQRLERGKMYRIDRHDADENIPLWATVEEQLEYCRTHLLRIMAREGTFTLNEKGLRVWEGTDIIRPDDEIALGSGWFAPENASGKIFRHVDDGAVIDLPELPVPNTLILSVAPGPGAGGPITLRLTRTDGTLLHTQVITDVEEIRVPLPASAQPGELLLGIDAIRVPLARDTRDLLLRVLAVMFDQPIHGGLKRKGSEKESSEVLTPAEAALTFADKTANWMRSTLPGIHGVIAPLYRHLTGRPEPEPVVPVRNLKQHTAPNAGAAAIKTGPVYLHTNACGDFTLMHRDHWMDVRGYAEFDAYSMNIDSVLCWAAHYAGYHQELLSEPMRVYHVEHGRGSGWTPEGRDILYRRIKEAGLPWIEYEDIMAWARSMNELNCPIIFNKNTWGFRDDVLREIGPGVDDASAALRWCRTDPDSPSQLKARAGTLCFLRPLTPFPDWRFDYAWDSADPATQERRAIWERCAKLDWKLGLVTPWLEGTRLALDMRNEISKQIYIGGCYDPNEFYWLSQVLQPGMTFLDVGANEGLYTVFAAARVGAAGRVIAFEPSSRERAALEGNLKLNGFSNVTVRHEAVGGHAGAAQLRVAVAGRSGLNSLGEFGLSDVVLDHVEEVPLATLDQLTAELALDRIDVIKIDIEGAETAMLRAARATIERYHPWLLVEAAERSLVMLGTSLAELGALLRSYGYELLAINTATGLAAPWNGELPTEGYTNLICRPPGKS